MYLNLTTGKTITDQEAREIERNNQKILLSGGGKIQIIVKVG